MDRVSQLADELSSVLDRLQEEAAGRELRALMAPLAWLDEANFWLRDELARMQDPERREPVQFTYMPAALRN